MVQETRVKSQVESYQNLDCLNIGYILTYKPSNTNALLFSRWSLASLILTECSPRLCAKLSQVNNIAHWINISEEVYKQIFLF